MNTTTTTTNHSLRTLSAATARDGRRLARAAAAGMTTLVLVCAVVAAASAQQDPGMDTGPTPGWTTVPAVARIGAQIIRCDTGEGNLSGAGAAAPLTLPDITTCRTDDAASAAPARQLEHDPLR